MKKSNIIQQLQQIITNNFYYLKKNIKIDDDIKFLKVKNLLTLYKEDINIMNLTIDIENYEKMKTKINNETKYILIFYVPDIYVSEQYRNKKNSFLLFYNLCIYLISKFKNDDIFLTLDDCTGYDYKRNIYSKMGFLVEQENNNKLVSTNEWIEDEFNKNPNENRYGYVPTIIKNCIDQLGYDF